MRGWRGGCSWCAPRPGAVRRSCWLIGPGAADRPVAWLSLDAADNDPARFWRHVIAALDRARPDIGERVGPLLGPPAPTSFEGLVTSLINELDAGSGQDEVLLVLDDYHLIGARQVHAPLQFLVEHLPPGLHLVWPAGPTRRCRWRGCGLAGS